MVHPFYVTLVLSLAPAVISDELQPCKCTGTTNVAGEGGECGTWCYVGKESSCIDAKESTLIEEMVSEMACQETSCTVTILQATNLKKGTDAYAIVKDPKDVQQFRTTTIGNHDKPKTISNPVWNEESTFTVESWPASFTFEVWDEDVFGETDISDTLRGDVEILVPADGGQYDEVTVTLPTRYNSSLVATLTLRLQCVPTTFVHCRGDTVWDSARCVPCEGDETTCATLNDQCVWKGGACVKKRLCSEETDLLAKCPDLILMTIGHTPWCEDSTHKPICQKSCCENGNVERINLDLPYDRFTIQCSHNTYIWGVQSSVARTPDSAHPDAFTAALNLGYRCIEVDAWPRKAQVLRPNETWAGPAGELLLVESHMQVGHAYKTLGFTRFLTNTFDFLLFIRKVYEWLEDDESKPCKLRLPLLISLEHHSTEDVHQEYLARGFALLGDRIIKPRDFTPQHTMRSFVNNCAGGDPKRKIIIKGKKATVAALDDMISLDKKKKEEKDGAYLAKSISMGSLLTPRTVTSGNRAEIKAQKNMGKLIRTYTHLTLTHSGNYGPSDAYRAGAHMVCVNWQGACTTRHDVCRMPTFARADAEQCNCSRHVGAHVEKAFLRYGYDGYAESWQLDECFFSTVDGKSCQK